MLLEAHEVMEHSGLILSALFIGYSFIIGTIHNDINDPLRGSNLSAQIIVDDLVSLNLLRQQL